MESAARNRRRASAARPDLLVRRLLAWYDRHARILPWRVPPGEDRRPDPYHVWLSEIMLQQTAVAAVGRYFRDFLVRWPAVHDLAAAPLDDVLSAWAGLGYYARARNLHRCAQVVVERHQGRFPADMEALGDLPGVGPYTAAAIAAIAFDQPAVPVDGNVERVMARMFAIDRPLPGAKPALREAVARFVSSSRPGDVAQALMDLGATLCTPRNAKCLLCPWQEDCAAHARGLVDALPARAVQRERPLRQGVAFVLQRTGSRGDKAIWVRRRPPAGLLGGMLEVPSTPWQTDPALVADVNGFAPGRFDWREIPGTVRHVFTHFELRLKVLSATCSSNEKEIRGKGEWLAVERVARAALPTVMKKVLAHAGIVG